MPKSNSKNSSRKSTASSKGTPKVVEDEDGYPTVVIRHTPSPIKKVTPKSPRPEFLESLVPTPMTPPPSPWENLGMHEEEYNAMMNRVFSRYKEIERDALKESMIQDLDDPVFWRMRADQLERERSVFNRKRGWSAVEMARVEQIDLELEECEMELEKIFNLQDELEYMCD
jgi:hypothetical protein